MKSLSHILVTACLSSITRGFQIPTSSLTTRIRSTRLFAQASEDIGKPWLLPAAIAGVLLVAPDLPSFHPTAANAASVADSPSVVSERSSTPSTIETSYASSSSIIMAPDKMPLPSILTLSTPRTGPIMDLSHVLFNQEQLAILKRKSHAEAKTGTELQIIVTDEIPSQMTPKQMATALFNQYGIGPAGKNNGVLILAVLDQRRIEMEVRKGIGKTMNAAWCTSALQETAVPQFRQGAYGQAILQTVDRVSDRLIQIEEQANIQVSTKNDSNKLAVRKSMSVVFFLLFLWLSSVMAMFKPNKTVTTVGSSVSPKIADPSDDDYLQQKSYALQMRKAQDQRRKREQQAKRKPSRRSGWTDSSSSSSSWSSDGGDSGGSSGGDGGGADW